jgi:hypothetical protein
MWFEHDRLLDSNWVAIPDANEPYSVATSVPNTVLCFWELDRLVRTLHQWTGWSVSDLAGGKMISSIA